ncbi:calcipressin-2-like [Tachypleus tridentatus]|uniref:calcipressin-2-like n=1 Tax=Tachypleus tridentatus TaxID=6853 RepID=UPI003FD0AE00
MVKSKFKWMGDKDIIIKNCSSSLSILNTTQALTMERDLDCATEDNGHFLDDEGLCLEDTSDLPTSLIITNIDQRVFSDQQLKANFEDLFKNYEEDATFQYFKSFKRARVNFQSPASAAQARIHCHQYQIGENCINCYFAQQSSSKETDPSDIHLQPPTPEKQFLISPPASPPVGWAPVDEAHPAINYDILSAIADLTPGGVHELHPPSSSQPGIVVHVCEKREDQTQPKLKIVQTRCPERVPSLEEFDSPSPPNSAD